MLKPSQNEKLWEECSAEEKAEISLIEQKYSQLRKDYLEEKINQRQYRNRRSRLLNKLSEIEEKYSEDEYEIKLFEIVDDVEEVQDERRKKRGKKNLS